MNVPSTYRMPNSLSAACRVQGGNERPINVSHAQLAEFSMQGTGWLERPINVSHAQLAEFNMQGTGWQ